MKICFRNRNVNVMLNADHVVSTLIDDEHMTVSFLVDRGKYIVTYRDNERFREDAEKLVSVWTNVFVPELITLSGEWRDD